MQYAAQISIGGHVRHDDTLGPFDTRDEAEAVASFELVARPWARAEVYAITPDEALDLFVLDEEILDALAPAHYEEV